MEKRFHANRNEKKSGVKILVSDKIKFKINTVTRDKVGLFIMIKVAIQQGNITSIIYTPNGKASKYIEY